MNSSGQDTIQSNLRKPRLAIIGGSGMCSFPELKVLYKLRPETEFGFPSDEISICEYGEQQVAFLPRHGSKHTFAPHKIPYKANMLALKSIGVEYVLGACVVGSLKKSIIPGSLVLIDQFVNLTCGRDATSGTPDGSFIHLPMGEPYCRSLRQKVLEVADATETAIIPKGTVVVIQGPRFSTAAESRWFSANGWDIVNMTQYPECYFARELGLCYAVIAAVTDYDAGLQESLVIDPTKIDLFLPVFKENVRKTRNFLLKFIELAALDLSCKCASIVIKAYFEEAL